MSNITWYSSNEQAQWKQKQHEQASSPATLEADGRSYQKMLGFGGCFNELGYRALSHLTPTDRAALLTELGELGINMEDLRLEHSPGAQIGFAEIAVLPEVAERAISDLKERGWRTL